MKRLSPLLLSVLSGLLLWASWPTSPLTFLIFFAFVPLLWLEHQGIRRSRFFYATFLTLLIWNTGTTWWICNATLPGGIAALLFNSSVMMLPWILFYFVKRKISANLGYIFLILAWLSFEYIHFNWQMSWPWLTLGNVFALHPEWVQWYEYIGTSGGSLWIWIMNILLFKLLIHSRKNFRIPFHQFIRASPVDIHNPLKVYFATALLWLLLPVVASIEIGRRLHLSSKNANNNIVVVQPNIDPYSKFDAGSTQAQLQKLIQLSEAQIDSNTSLLVWPETALASEDGFQESKLKEYPALYPLWSFLAMHPQITLYTGIEAYRLYTEATKTATSNHIRDSDQYYEAYNSAALLNSNGALVFYHKSKLVPLVETMPPVLKFLTSWFEQFGGTTGGYTGQLERTVLTDNKMIYKIAPSICYESDYGEFMTTYVRQGANLIGIITNDGWWNKTAGYRQHMQYARLRAIETRRWVARSANTGISCFINPAGKVFAPQPWDKEAAIKMNVPIENKLTFFVKQGDIISRVALVATGLLLVWSVIISLRKRSNAKENSL